MVACVFVQDQTEKICLTAVRQNGMILKHVLNQTERICVEAVKQNRSVIALIRDEPLREKVKAFLDSST